MTKYFIDLAGNYIGAFDGAEPPIGAVEVPVAPDDARQPWLGDRWGEVQKTAEQLQAEVNDEARAYLLSTDWYVIRSQETGEAIPAEILAERQAARDRVVE
jgi:hypothetical protein